MNTGDKFGLGFAILGFATLGYFLWDIRPGGNSDVLCDLANRIIIQHHICVDDPNCMLNSAELQELQGAYKDGNKYCMIGDEK